MMSVGIPQRQGDLVGFIGELRQRVAAERRVFMEPQVKTWCARRWRYLFISEAMQDPIAMEAAGKSGDKRPARQRIAERYLADGAEAAWRDEQPDAVETRIATTTFLVCPGLLNGMLPVREFRDDLPTVERRFGMRTLRSASHPARGCEANVADLMRALNEGKGSDAAAKPIPDSAARAPGDVFAVCYSKGSPDMLTTLVRHPELKSRVRCLFTWAGAIGGSQVADDAARKIKALGLEKHAAEIISKLKGFGGSFFSSADIARMRIDEFDTVGAIRDLTTSVRQAFLAEHSQTLDAMNIPMFSLRGVTKLNEVPFSQRGGFKLLSKFDPHNDMQVAGKCSVLPFPMATELAVLHGHHWDLAYPAFRKRRWLNNTLHPFPKTAALTAMVQLSSELGLID